jgi:uncharacterized protein YggE
VVCAEETTPPVRDVTDFHFLGVLRSAVDTADARAWSLFERTPVTVKKIIMVSFAKSTATRPLIAVVMASAMQIMRGSA